MTPLAHRLRPLALALLAWTPAGAPAQDALGPNAAEAPAERRPAERDAALEAYLQVGLSLDCANSLDEHLSQRVSDPDALRRRLVEIIREGLPREWIMAEVAGLQRIDDLLAPWKLGQCPGDATVERPPCPPAAQRVNYARLVDRRIRERALAQYRLLDPAGAARDVDAWRADERLDPILRALLR